MYLLALEGIYKGALATLSLGRGLEKTKGCVEGFVWEARACGDFMGSQGSKEGGTGD